MNKKVSLHLGQPVVIAQSEPLKSEHDNWGPFQFPEIERLGDGRLHAIYHIRKDSALAYGKSKGHAVSADDGRTWESIDENRVYGGILLKNGDRLRLKALPAVSATEVDLPEIPDDEIDCYSMTRKIYDSKKFPAEMNRWPLERLRAGEKEWQLEMKAIDIPQKARFVGEGVFPANMFWRLRLEASGRIWAISYPYFFTGRHPTVCCPLFCISEDHGHTFTFLSSIPYTPDTSKDPQWQKRVGFGEPDVAFMPDGSILCLIRTTDGHGIAPSYICHSYDRGATWTKPSCFDDNGVWPTLLTLKNGITLATYGRPGLFLRATQDPAGKIWDERVAVVPPGAYQTETCSYADLIALDDNTAYIVYSDFNYPNKDGIPVKSIMGMRIETNK